MIKDAIGFIVSAVASLQPKRGNPHRDIFGRVIEHGEEFFHPQTFKGIPVFDTESIMRHYKPLLEKLAMHTDIGDHRKTPDGKQSLFDALYTDVIRRYVEYAHMIPASEDHHHSHTGGLIVHSLEVSIASLRFAKEMETPKTGFSDTDNQLRPIMHYCAWLAGFLHDAGKIMIDVSVDAAEIIHPLTKRPTPMTSPIPSWRPQKESLTEWAFRYNVASYSVSFYNDRKHKRHNVDAVQILKPILNNSYALDYILSSPLQSETYSELCRVLSGWSKSKDYLSSAVRHGDADSTGRNVGIEYDRIRGNRTLSTASRIYQAIRNARKEWDWNTHNAEGWVIGGDVYLRWTSAIDSIAKVAKEMQHALPTDARNLLTIMESNGLVQMYDKANRMIKFSPGGYKPEDIPLISSGKKNLQWIDLFKMRGREMVFGADPMPDSVAGLIFLSESGTFIIIDKDGIATEFKGDTGEVAQTANTLPPAAPRESKSTHIPADIPVHNVVKLAQPEKPTKANQIATPKSEPQTEELASKTVVEVKAPPAIIEPASDAPTDSEPVAPKTKTLALLPKQSDISNADAIAQAFASDFPSTKTAEAIKTAETPKADIATIETASKSDKPSKKQKASTEPSQTKQASAPIATVVDLKPTTPVQADPVVTKPKRCSPVLSTLLDMHVKYYVVGTKVLIDVEDAEAKSKLTLKEILSDLEGFAHTAVNLSNPNQKTEIVTSNQEKKKAIPVSPSLVAYFKYENSASKQESPAEKTPTPTTGKETGKQPVATKSGNDSPQQQTPKSKPVAANTPQKEVTATSKANSKKDAAKAEPLISQNDAPKTTIEKSKKEANQSKATVEPGEWIEKILLSDARSFVLSGKAYVDIDGLAKFVRCTVKELVSQLHGANLLFVEVGKPSGEHIHEQVYLGQKYRTVTLRKEYTHRFSSHVPFEQSGNDNTDTTNTPVSTPVSPSEKGYTLSLLLGNAEPDAVIHTLMNYLPVETSLIIAEADHVKVDVLKIISALTPHKFEIPFSLSGLKRALRHHSSGESVIGKNTYTHISNDVLLTLTKSEI